MKPETSTNTADAARVGSTVGSAVCVEETWRADAAERRAAEAEATVWRMRELLEEVIDGSVDASCYPDGPCLDRDLRKRIKAELSPNAEMTDGYRRHDATTSPKSERR